MHVTCPNCRTEYEVPDEAITGRTRILRCTYCGNQWRHSVTAEGPEDAATTAPPPQPAPPPDIPPLLPNPPPALPSRQPPPASPRRSRAPLLTILVIAVLVVAALAAHRPISRAWPASAGFYRAMGLS